MQRLLCYVRLANCLAAVFTCVHSPHMNVCCVVHAASQKSRTTTNRSGAGSSRGKSTRTCELTNNSRCIMISVLIVSEKESTVENPGK